MSVDMVSGLPPAWVDTVQDIESRLVRLAAQLDQMDILHKKNLLPGFDDSLDHERSIEHLSDQVTRDFGQCQHLIKRISALIYDYPPGMQPAQEALVAKNAQIALATRLQQLTTRFRHSQSQYLNKLKGRDSRVTDFLIHSGLDSVLNSDPSQVISFSQQQHQQEHPPVDTSLIDARTHAINEIAQSIIHLSELFRDLQTLVIDQGTLLDRIDYNIETAKMDLHSATKEIVKAEQLQKGGRARLCIVVLAVLILFLLIIALLKRR